MSPQQSLNPKLFEESVAAVAMFAGPDHRLVYTNAACARMLGVRTLGRPAREIFPEPDSAEFLTALDDVFTTGRPCQLTGSRRPDPGAVEQARYFVYSCTPVTTPNGVGVLMLTMDTSAETIALQRYEALVSAVSQMVWVMHADGSMAEIVSGWEQLTGVPWRGRADKDWYAYLHPRDRDKLSRAWRTAATTEPPGIFQSTFRVRTKEGSYRHMTTRGVPIVRDGQVDEWIAATVDVEDTWSTSLRDRLVAQVAEASGGSLAEAFAEVVKVVVPELADACVILLLSHDEWPLPDNAPVSARRVASAARGDLPPPAPLKAQQVTATDAVRHVLHSGLPKTIALSPGHPAPPDLVPEVTEQWLAASGATSLTLVPLVVDELVLGYAVAVSTGDSPLPGPAEVELLREVLHHARRPIRKVLDLQQARRTALKLQRAHLTQPPAVPGGSLAACYQPASSSTEIGGDWYDAILHPDGTLTLDIGDVAGHDLTAATAMGQMRSMLRALAWSKGPDGTPSTVLSLLDDAAEGLNIATFTTAVHSHLRRQADGSWLMSWSNAGHPPPLLLPARGEPRFLHGSGQDAPLCVVAEMVRVTHTHTLGAGDTLVYYTDGLIETPTTDLDEGQHRLLQAAAQHRTADLSALLTQLQHLSDGRDDTAMIAFRVDPR
ncbi:SpoIIE family protein phosphatase [Streptomyces sp. NPDC006733]|uniref:SpoIIE family protein phosphatase n=1 Tax=Streptomyces sp. NPDC006733 TaxID=3155460 RepID=UPI0033DC74EC